MWFHFCTANHDPIGRSTLVDMLDWFTAGLKDLGHKVTYSETSVECRAVNVFWDGFGPGMGERIRDSGVEYGVVATEIPDGNAFNWRTEPDWKERFDSFFDVARSASFIWTMIESTVPFYSQFCRTAFIELGYSDRLIPSYTAISPEYDFSFFGLETPYRTKIVEKLRKHASVVWPKTVLSVRDIGILIGKTKVGLSIKQSQPWPIPSPTRLGRFMMAKRDIAAEHVDVPTRQGSIITLSAVGQDFADFSLDRLYSDWKARAERTFEIYRTTMPMRDIMCAVLEKTVGRIETSKTRNQSVFLGDIRPPILVETKGQWNIVFYENLYYALLHTCGDVDIRTGLDKLIRIYGRSSVCCSSSKNSIYKKIARRENYPKVFGIADRFFWKKPK